MDMEGKIKAAVAYGNTSLTDVAKRMPAPQKSTTGAMSVSNLSQKIKKGSLSVEDLEHLATAMGAELCLQFVFPDGTRI